MSTVTRHPTIRRIPHADRNTTILYVQTEVQEEEVQPEVVQKAEEPRFQDSMEGVETGRQGPGLQDVGDQEITLR